MKFFFSEVASGTQFYHNTNSVLKIQQMYLEGPNNTFQKDFIGLHHKNIKFQGSVNFS